MNILLVMPLGEFGGGAEQMLYHYLTSRPPNSELRLSLLFLSSGKLADAASKLGYRTAVILAGRVRDVPRLISTQIKIGKLIVDWRIDRILAWMPKACAYVTLPALVRDKALFIWRHDIPNSLDRLDSWVLRFGKPVSIACSSEAANHALRNCGISGFSTRAIHPGVPARSFDPEAVKVIRDRILSRQHGFVIGTVTRLQPWKRVDLFLESVACLKKKIPNVKALVVGGESHGLSKGHGDELKSLGRRLLGDDAVFVGEQQNVGDWLAAMDVFVLPSDSEPFGIALVEALAAGKPVVACSGGGPDEIVQGDVVGRLLPQKPTPEQMAESIQKMLSPTERHLSTFKNPLEAQRFSPVAMSNKIDNWLSLTF